MDASSRVGAAYVHMLLLAVRATSAAAASLSCETPPTDANILNWIQTRGREDKRVQKWTP